GVSEASVNCSRTDQNPVSAEPPILLAVWNPGNGTADSLPHPLSAATPSTTAHCRAELAPGGPRQARVAGLASIEGLGHRLGHRLGHWLIDRLVGNIVISGGVALSARLPVVSRPSAKR